MNKEQEKIRNSYPMVPIRDVVVFPYMMVPFVIGRESSVLALEKALHSDKRIFLATQRDASDDNPSSKEIYEIGTVATIAPEVLLQQPGVPQGP
ncbi:MAG: LON peptidase substrate-binding domain-containing protein, partial [bacterium]